MDPVISYDNDDCSDAELVAYVKGLVDASLGDMPTNLRLGIDRLIGRFMERSNKLATVRVSNTKLPLLPGTLDRTRFSTNEERKRTDGWNSAIRACRDALSKAGKPFAHEVDEVEP